MGGLLKKSAPELADILAVSQTIFVKLTQACLDRIDAIEDRVNAFVTVDREGALATVAGVNARHTAGETLYRLTGMPVTVKDDMVMRDLCATCVSKILDDWKSPYDTTVTAKIKEAGLSIIDKTNMDGSIIGSSTKHSAFGMIKNLWDTKHIPGGSGGGSAAAVAVYTAPLTLGPDTDGSTHQPAFVIGTVGAKSVYDVVSHFDLVAMTSSLGQIGPVARMVADAAVLTELIGGYDPNDPTSLNEPAPAPTEAVESVTAQDSMKDLRVDVVKELNGKGYQKNVIDTFDTIVEKLREAGAEIVEVPYPYLKYSLGAYYLIMSVGVSSNPVRFDGMRYGIRVEPTGGLVTAERVVAATREVSSGSEVKRRIILGTHVLSAGYYGTYYGSAQKMRMLIQRDFDAVLEQVDVLVSPVAPETVFKFGEKTSDPLAMYLYDVVMIPASPAGIPGANVSDAVSSAGLPIDSQVLAPARGGLATHKVASPVEALNGDVADQCPAANWEEK